MSGLLSILQGPTVIQRLIIYLVQEIWQASAVKPTVQRIVSKRLAHAGSAVAALCNCWLCSHGFKMHSYQLDHLALTKEFIFQTCFLFNRVLCKGTLVFILLVLSKTSFVTNCFMIVCWDIIKERHSGLVLPFQLCVLFEITFQLIMVIVFIGKQRAVWQE